MIDQRGAQPRFAAALVLLVLLGALARFVALPAQSLSTDEVSELDLAEKRTAAALLRAPDGFPPLFHWLLQSALAVLPEAWAARAVSALCGTLTLLPFAAWAARRSDRRTALCATLLLSLSPFHVQLSRDGRAYALYVLLAAIALAAWERALLTDRRRAWSAFVAASALGLATHYYFVLLLVALAPLALTVPGTRVRSPRALGAFAVLSACAALLAVFVLGPDLAHQQGYDGGAVSYRRPVDLYALGYAGFEVLLGVGLGPSKAALHEQDVRAALLGFAPWLLALLVVLAPVARALLRRPVDRATRWPLALAFLPPLVAALLAAALHVHFKPSYVAWVVLPALLVVARAYAGAPAARLPLPARVLLPALLLLQVLALVRGELLPQYQREDLRSAARALAERGAVAAVTSAGYLNRPLARYWRQGTVWPLPDVGCRRQNLARAWSRVEAQRAESPDGRAYLVSGRLFHGDPCRHLHRLLAERYATTVVHRGAGVEVIALRARAAADTATRGSTP